jgi:acetylornithine deacetylase
MTIKIPASVKELLISLVRIPSVNQFITGKKDAEHDVSVYLQECVRFFGLESRLLDVPGTGNNLLITKEFSKGAPWIMFASHMDTVSSEGMDFDPFAAKEINGRIPGRGSCDDKGSLAAAVWALKEIAVTGKSPNNIAILGTIDEEQQRTGATAFADIHLQTLGFIPRGVIVAEPTKLKPIVTHAGIAHFTVTVKGRAAHASDPSKGRSAIKDMMKVIEALEEGYIAGLNATDPLCGKAQCSINMIQGGRQVNAVPDLCCIRVDRRLMPNENAENVLPEVEKVLDGLRRLDPQLQVSSRMDFKDNPLTQDTNSGFIQGVLKVLKNSAMDAKPLGASYATDAGTLNKAGLPCVVLGPGEDAMAHTSNESIGVAELEEGVRVFMAMMMQEFPVT